MKPIEGWEKEQAAIPGDFQRLPAGGYVCIIVGAKEAQAKSGRKMLQIALDVVDGEYRDYFSKEFERRRTSKSDAKWPCVYYQLTEGDSVRFFKGLITVIEGSNPPYIWDWNEEGLKGKLVGVVFREEEYVGNDGKIHSNVKPYQFRTVDKIEAGEFTVPEVKRVDSAANTFGGGMPDEEIPF